MLFLQYFLPVLYVHALLWNGTEAAAREVVNVLAIGCSFCLHVLDGIGIRLTERNVQGYICLQIEILISGIITKGTNPKK